MTESVRSDWGRARIAFMLLDTVPTPLALPCTDVLRVSRILEWHDAPPIPFDALVPAAFASAEPVSVMHIRGIAGSLALRISGAIRVEHLSGDSLVEISAFKYRGFELFSDVVLVQGKPSALVVNIDALIRVRRESVS